MNDNDIERFFSKVEQGENEDDCWKWLGSKKKAGYGEFGFRNKKILAHRFSYEYHNNCQIKNGIFILHSCDNPECTNPKHLREGTAKENNKDMMLRNRQNNVKGEECHLSKLTEQQVIEIRSRYANEETSNRKLAKDYNVSAFAVSSIINRKTWKYI